MEKTYKPIPSINAHDPKHNTKITEICFFIF